MFAAREVFGMSLEDAEILRRVVGKKKLDEIPAWKEKIYTAAEANGLTKEVADYFWAFVEAAGNYSFTVKELNSNSVYSSTLEVLDFDIEKQFVNPDWNKLNQLANQTSGKAYLANQADILVKQLMADESYKAIQKTLVKKSPLIDWIWLLVLIAISLATEWFVRKYNGLL